MIYSLIFFTILFYVTNCHETVDCPTTAAIYHTFYNCKDPTYFPNVVTCDNEGYFECSRFDCSYPHITEPDPFCRYGIVDMTKCCDCMKINFAEMWIDINGNPYIDWEWGVYNLEFKGNGGDIYIEDNFGFGVLLEDVYEYDCINSTKLYLAARIDYNSTCSGILSFFVNGQKVLNESDIQMQFNVLIFMKAMISIDREFGNNEKVYMIAGWEKVEDCPPPTDDQIMELYEMGGNRTADTEMPPIEGGVDDEALQTFMILLVIILSLIGLILCLGFVLFIGWILFSRTDPAKERRYSKISPQKKYNVELEQKPF